LRPHSFAVATARPYPPPGKEQKFFGSFFQERTPFPIPTHMKPVPFAYRRATTIAEACAWLNNDPSSLLIAGGQTLMPMLAMRLARPATVIDIMRIPGLDGIDVSASHITIGAATRQHVIEHSRIIEQELPLLARAMPWVGHPPTRRRGTIGGSIANADPAAEIALCGIALSAEVLLAGPTGEISMKLQDFLQGPMTTALPRGAMVTALRFPRHVTPPRIAFREVARRHGDYALVAAAVTLTLAPDGTCTQLACAIGGAPIVPTLLSLPLLIGTTLSPSAINSALKPAVADIEMMNDHNASSAYRRRAAQALAAQAITEAKAA
jgi:CO/xanthine dehydrogenase FAD-binding subunit